MKPSAVIGFLLVAFLALRLIFIFTFPPFTDESLYIRWGQLMVDNPQFRFASIDFISRQPLAFWVFGFGAILIKNPLVGGRLMVLFLNIPSFFAVYFLTKRLGSRRAAIWAAAILAFTPLFILIQSLALMDGLLFGISAVILWLLVSDRKTQIPYQDIAIALLLAFALWIKTTSLLLVVLVTGWFIIKKQWKNLLLVSLTAAVLLLPLILRKDIAKIISEPGSFTLTTSELIRFPVTQWANNFLGALISLLIYLGPVMLYGFIAFRSAAWRKNYLPLLWAALPLLFMLVVGKNPLVRYYAFGLIGLIPLVSNEISLHSKTGKRLLFAAAGLLLLSVYGLFFVLRPVSFFNLFPKSSGERDYAFSWPSGYGIPELTRWIDSRLASGGTLLLAVADSPGNPSDYFLAYYYFHPRVRVIFVTLTSEAELRKVESLTKQVPVYIATRQSLITDGVKPYLSPVIVFSKPANQDAVGLFRVVFETNGAL